MGVCINGSKLNFARNYTINSYSSYSNAITKKTVTYNTYNDIGTMQSSCIINALNKAYICLKIKLSSMFTVSDLNFNNIDTTVPNNASLYSFDSDSQVVWSWYQQYGDVNWGYYKFIEKLNSGKFTVNFSTDSTYLYIKFYVNDITKMTNYSGAITDSRYSEENKKFIRIFDVFGALKYNGKYVMFKNDASSSITIILDGQSSSDFYLDRSAFVYQGKGAESFVFYEDSGNKTSEQLSKQYCTSGDYVNIAADSAVTFGFFIWCFNMVTTGTATSNTDNWPMSVNQPLSGIGYPGSLTINSTTRRELNDN